MYAIIKSDMKKYKILISSTLLLTSTVTVQATTLIEVRLTGAVGGYSAGDYVAFSSISDFLALSLIHI